MLDQPLSRRSFVTGMLYLGTGAVGQMWLRDAEGAPNPNSPPPFPDSRLCGGPNHYLTYVSTDKPIYRSGDKVYVRGVVLQHTTHEPLPSQPAVHSTIEIVGPKGDVVATGAIAVEDAVLGFSWTVPEGQPGGEYTAKITFPHFGHTPAERKFDIRSYRAPRLKSQIQFLREGYGPGDEVVATWHIERAEGGIPTDAKLTVTARVDEQQVFQGPGTLDPEGRGIVRFRLPADIVRGEGTLAVVIEDGGVVETATKTLPILLQTVDVATFPEGGELLAGVKNRVYFEARTPAQRPADIAGVVVDATGQEIARFRSEHEGRGRFEFTPAAGQTYALRITEPAGLRQTYPLGDIRTTGAVLSAVRETFRHDEPIRVEVATPLPSVVATLSQREVLLNRQVVSPREAQPATVTFETPATACGVLTVTLWDAEGKPLAERLVFRQPTHSVQVRLKTDAASYSPGGKVSLQVQTSDERGAPISAIVGLTVTDDSVLEMVEKRQQAARLPVMVYLENDVRELADAQIYLDPHSDRAELAVDLLLGTQGWRRFALVDWQKFVEQHQDAARRAWALTVPVQEDELIMDRSEGARVFSFRGLSLARSARSAPIDALLFKEKADKDLAKGGAGDRDQARFILADREVGLKLEAGVEEVAAKRRADSQLVSSAFVYVRVYAHQVAGPRTPETRTDFTETLFWHAGLKTDARGQATIEFALNDAITTFRALADAFTKTGAVGTGTTLIESVRPFYLEPKLPLHVTQGDQIVLPIACVNSTSQPLDNIQVSLTTAGASAVSPSKKLRSLPARSRERTLTELSAGAHCGPTTVTVSGSAGPFHDQVSRTFEVHPRGFPVEVAAGGLIEADSTIRQTIEIPPDVVAGSFVSQVDIYPTPLASLTEALQALLREPCGCFEQTSSTVYPLIMAQAYFLSHQGVPAALIEKSAAILNSGYDRLRGFECQNGGFEWFGHDPGHDALTAYGLMEFSDLQKVRPVDSTLIERTRKWLLDQRNGRGTFERKTHTLHTWLAEPEVSTAYNVWALLSAGATEDLSTEIQWIRDAAVRTANTYVLALSTLVLQMAGDKPAALLDRLAGQQTAGGAVEGATVSVIGSTGEALQIETTALAVLAWLPDPQFAVQVERGIRFLAESCKAGRFGSTQSTILALKAILAYDQARAVPLAAGQVELRVDQQLVGTPVHFDKQTHGTISLPRLPVLTPGQHTIELRMTGGSRMPYAVAARFTRLQPETSDRCQLTLETTLKDRKVVEGAVTEARIAIVNRTNETVPTPLAVIGIPGGLEVRHDQLKDLVKAGTIAAYEVLGHELALYWRALPPEERVSLPISLVAAVPGRYTGQASRAYLYYTNEDKFWAPGLQVEITPVRG
ncbi:MAG: A-macroglobulin complement component [Planctomycetes bacterium]|nr:A-macroglobulin complement component [Planctomycetota bacterium]